MNKKSTKERKKITRINIEDAVATAQWVQTKHEWEKHIEFVRRHVNKKVIQQDLDIAIEWYERIFGEYKPKND